MDDLVTGCQDTEGAIALYEKAKSGIKEGGFSLRKWKTNDRELTGEIAKREELSVKKRAVPEDPSYAKETLGTPDSAGRKTKVLVINWDIEDTWEFDLEKRGEEIGKTA